MVDTGNSRIEPIVVGLSGSRLDRGSTLESIVKWNGRLHCGMVSLRKVGEEDVLILGSAQPLATADYDEIEKMILYVARRGNTLKQFLRAGH